MLMGVTGGWHGGGLHGSEGPSVRNMRIWIINADCALHYNTMLDNVSRVYTDGQ